MSQLRAVGIQTLLIAGDDSTPAVCSIPCMVMLMRDVFLKTVLNVMVYLGRHYESDTAPLAAESVVLQ